MDVDRCMHYIACFLPTTRRTELKKTEATRILYHKKVDCGVSMIIKFNLESDSRNMLSHSSRTR